ncbi:hypothetical protein HK104_008304 [Borealophlyctis nickersoniae]|nr:hypothetical protein HK104_008304 [Borealophlyctis nickersoniae]
MAVNWVCHARNLGVQNYILVAADDKAHEELGRRTGEQVVRMDSLLLKENKNGDYGPKEEKGFVLGRYDMTIRVLESGYSVVLADPEAPWLDNPLPHIEKLMDDNDVISVENATGLTFVKANERGVAFLKRLIKELYTTENPVEMETSISNMVLSGMENGFSFLPHKLFLRGTTFFGDGYRHNIHGHPWPVVITSDDVANSTEKEERLQKYGLWMIKERDTCWNPAPTLETLWPPKKGEDHQQFNVTRKPVKFLIKVLTYGRPNSLTRLLNSLSNAEYPANHRIDVDIYIDHPKKPVPGALESHSKVIDIVDQWEWNRGEKRVHVRNFNVGLAGQWFELWYPASWDEVAFVLEDDLELSPLWYRWLRAAVSHYYEDSDNFDPNMYGISLQNQGTCLGHCRVSVKNGNEPFKYQLVGTWGQLLFPYQWVQFMRWMDEKRAILTEDPKGYSPLFSTLMSNGWYMAGRRSPKKAWTFDFISFVAEHGYYNLYTNFEGKRSLSVCHREAGEHYGSSQGADREMLGMSQWKDSMLDFPPSALMPVFDYQFNKVQNIGALRHRKFALRGQYPKK